MLGPNPPGTGDPFATAFNTLASDITAAQQTVPLTSAASFPTTGGVILIGTEQMAYSAISGNTLLGVNRGINGTTAAAHGSGANVACSTLTVTDANHGAVENDFVTYADVTGPFGGFAASDINGERQVFGLISASQYTINIASVFSTSATSGGGAAATATYQVNTGLDTYVVGLGWGADPWSSGGWGSPGVVGVGQQLRLWSADNFGEDLFFAPREGAVYYWDATLGTTVRGVALSDASTALGLQGQFVPTTTNKIMSAPIQRFIICMGQTLTTRPMP